MKLKQLENNAVAFFESGYNCAESVSQAIIEAFSEKAPQDIPRVASAFGGGIGGSHSEACGALTGGIIAIGFLQGRTKPDQNIDSTKDLAKSYRDEFEKIAGSTNCGILLDQFGDQDNYFECSRLVGRATVVLAKLLKGAGLKMVR